jgi:putative acetyltransferase
MNPTITLRPETAADIAAIRDVTIAALATLEISGPHGAVHRRGAARGAGTDSVAGRRDRWPSGRAHRLLALGHFRWHDELVRPRADLGVAPELQRQGIGKALMAEGLARLKNLGAGGCCLVGHPEYYRKFGFNNLPGLALDGVPPEVFLSLSFAGRVPQGKVAFHEAFAATA